MLTQYKRMCKKNKAKIVHSLVHLKANFQMIVKMKIKKKAQLLILLNLINSRKRKKLIKRNRDKDF